MNTGKTVFGASDTLELYIDKYMPKGNSADCVGQCAADIAAFIQNGFSSTYPVVQKEGYTLQQIDACGKNETVTPKAFLVFGSTTGAVSGWNNLKNFNAPYDKLALSSDADRALYDVPNTTPATDNSCNNLKTQSMVLIKKIADWDNQHVNGLEPSVIANNKTFNDADKIVIELKLNKAKTLIPSKTSLKATYGATLTSEQYDQLDNGYAAFSFSLLNAKTDVATDKVEFQRFVELDQAKWADRWVRITIPVATMSQFTNEPWVRTATTAADQAATLVDRLRMNPEIYGSRASDAGTWGNVIRNLIDVSDNALFAAKNIPETFREFDISIKKIEILSK